MNLILYLLLVRHTLHNYQHSSSNPYTLRRNMWVVSRRRTIDKIIYKTWVPLK